MVHTPFKILFKYASRNRPERFFQGMDSIYDNLSDPENMYVLITCGEDDPTMNNPEVIERISKYKNAYVIFGENTGKLQATNKDLDLVGKPWCDWQIIVNMADDMRFIRFGFDDILRVDINSNFPDFYGLLHYWEPDTGSALAVMYIAGRKFFDRFGYIGYPEYKSLFWDNEYMESAKILCKYAYFGTHIFNHLCPAYSHHGLERDSQFNRDQDFWNYDEAIYYKRKAINFGL